MKTQYQQYFYNPKGHEIPLIFCTLENVETVNEFASLFRKDYDKMKEADIETCIRNYLTSGEFNMFTFGQGLATMKGQFCRKRTVQGIW